MRLEIQLYVSGQRVDLFEDESISLTQAIQDVKDVSKVFTDYSQSFTVPASSENNKIFKHYYNPDITNGFDARLKVDATIELNYQKFRSGKLKLEGVQLKDNKPYAYKVTFFGSTITLKDLIGEDLISDMDFSDYDTTFSPIKVATLLQNGATVNSRADAIICPLISAEQRWYYDSSDETSQNTGNIYPFGSLYRGANWRNFKYAIRVDEIVKMIESTYGLTFSTDFFTSSQTDYYNLYMWLHREQGESTNDFQSQYLNRFPTDTWSGYGFDIDGDYFTISQSGTYNVSINLDLTGSGLINVVWYQDTGSGYQEYARQNALDVADQPLLVVQAITETGDYKVAIEHKENVNILATSYLNVFKGGLDETFTFVSSQALSYSIDFAISDNIPKMKVIDFLTGLFKMFNLTAYEEDGTIVVKTLDDYYASYTTFDITDYVHSSNAEVNSSALYKLLNFKYKGLGTFLAKNHLEKFNLEWGTEEYSLNNQKYNGEEYTVEIPFEHMKMERLYDAADGSETDAMWGWYVDKLKNDNIDGEPYIGEPLLFYAIKQTSATSIRIQGFSNTNYDLTQYYIPSNSVALTDSQNINFKAEKNEYYLPPTDFTQTLFETYYSNYIEDVFDYRSRITKVEATLPLKVLTKYSLSDRFVISDRSYKINSINTNLLTGQSSLELISDL